MGLFEDFNHLLENGLLVVVAVEEQRIVGAALHGEIIQPRRAVVNSPECDAANLVAMLEIDFKQIGVEFVECLDAFLGDTVPVGIHFLVVLEVLVDVGTSEVFRIREHVQVELGHHDFHTAVGKSVHALLVFRKVGIVESVVALHADGIDAYSLLLEFAYDR